MVCAWMRGYTALTTMRYCAACCPPGDSKPSLEKKVLAGSLSGALAQAITSPIELMKTRLQAAGAAKAAAAAQAAAAAADSSAAPAAAAAAAAASGAGSTRVAASGAVGCPAAGPLIAGGSSAKPGPAAAVTAPPPRLPATTSLGVIREVVAADGVAGLWKGATPGLYRSAILTAAQCATYDEVGWELDRCIGAHHCHRAHSLVLLP